VFGIDGSDAGRARPPIVIDAELQLTSIFTSTADYARPPARRQAAGDADMRPVTRGNRVVRHSYCERRD
jgi:hypothetical protein